jgi:hypothetical protein
MSPPSFYRRSSSAFNISARCSAARSIVPPYGTRVVVQPWACIHIAKRSFASYWAASCAPMTQPRLPPALQVTRDYWTQT